MQRQSTVITTELFDDFRWDPQNFRVVIEHVINSANDISEANQNYAFLEIQMKWFKSENFPSQLMENSIAGGLGGGVAGAIYEATAQSIICGTMIGCLLFSSNTFFGERRSNRINKAYPFYCELKELINLAKNKVSAIEKLEKGDGITAQNKKNYAQDLPATGMRKRK